MQKYINKQTATITGLIVVEGTKSDGIVSVKKYLLEDYYYVLEELSRFVIIFCSCLSMAPVTRSFLDIAFFIALSVLLVVIRSCISTTLGMRSCLLYIICHQGLLVI